MSFDATIVLTNASGESVEFVRLNSDSTSTTYAMASATLQEPVLLTLAHTMTKSREGSDRHLAKISCTALDTEGRAFTAVRNETLSVPRLGVTSVHVDDITAMLKSFWTVSNTTKMLRGEL